MIYKPGNVQCELHFLTDCTIFLSTVWYKNWLIKKIPQFLWKYSHFVLVLETAKKENLAAWAFLMQMTEQAVTSLGFFDWIFSRKFIQK